MTFNDFISTILDAIKTHHKVFFTVEASGFSENRIVDISDVSLSEDEKYLTIYDSADSVITLDVSENMKVYQDDDEIVIKNPFDENSIMIIFSIL